MTLAAAVASPRAARADVSPSDRASAEALFEHGKLLMQDARYAEACPKFQESYRLDPGIGIMLYLADCFEKNGQTASAWGMFIDAAAQANAAKQAEREKKARARAAALEPKLLRMSITLGPGADPPGLAIKRDGVAISRAMLGTPVPLDPGEHTVEVSAAGKKPWTTKVKLAPGGLAIVVVTIPTLEDLPAPKVDSPPPPPKVAPPPPPPKASPAPVDSARARPEGRDAAEPPKPVQTTREGFSAARVTGGTFLGVGIASAAVGGILGAIALQKNSAAGNECWDTGVCSPNGRDDRLTARTLARGSDITLIAGGVLFTTGLIVLLATNAGSDNRVVLSLRPRIGGLSVGGSF